MLQNTHPLILELISLKFNSQLGQDFTLNIGLSKGFQTFGQLKFRVEASMKTVLFQENNTIRFFYTPRVFAKKDVLYRMTLIDVQSNEQVGEIPLSTNHFTEVFGNDKREVIEKTAQFDEDIHLHYKIFMPKQVTTQPKIRLRENNDTDDILNTLFSISASKPTKKRPPPVKIPEDKDIRKKTQAGFNLFEMLVPKANTQTTLSKANSQIKQADQKETPGTIPNINISFPGNQIHSPKNISQEIKPKTILVDLLQNYNKSLEKEEKTSISPDSSFIKERQYQKQLRKRTQIPNLMNCCSHHTSNEISLKLKFVIFLLILGLVTIYFDFIGDQWEAQIASKQ